MELLSRTMDPLEWIAGLPSYSDIHPPTTLFCCVTRSGEDEKYYPRLDPLRQPENFRPSHIHNKILIISGD